MIVVKESLAIFLGIVGAVVGGFIALLLGLGVAVCFQPGQFSDCGRRRGCTQRSSRGYLKLFTAAVSVVDS